jgi:RHS repeat-associated protein
LAAVANADGSAITPLNYSPTGRFLTGGYAYADFDRDNDVDADDFAALAACFTGPDVPIDLTAHPECANKNLDKDTLPNQAAGDVDGADYILFQACMSGSGNKPPLSCTPGGPPPAGNFGLHGRPIDVFTDPDGNRHALLFVRARHYDLTNGRWLQRDPKGYVDGPNLYEAFGGNPLANVDPTGEEISWWEYLKWEWSNYWSGDFNRRASGGIVQPTRHFHEVREDWQGEALGNKVTFESELGKTGFYDSCYVPGRVYVLVEFQSKGETARALVPLDLRTQRPPIRLNKPIPEHGCQAQDVAQIAVAATGVGYAPSAAMGAKHAIEHLKADDIEGGTLRIIGAMLPGVGADLSSAGVLAASMTSAPDAFTSAVLTEIQNGNAIPLSKNLIAANDALATFASNVHPSKGAYTVVAHGSPHSIDAVIAGRKFKNMDHRVLANLIQRSPDYAGEDIRLISCNTGRLPDGFAQNLSNKLGVGVVAPDDFLWGLPDGRYFVSPGKWVNSRFLPVWPAQGHMQSFRPGN